MKVYGSGLTVTLGTSQSGEKTSLIMAKLGTAVTMRTVPCLQARNIADKATTNTKIGQTLHAKNLRTSFAQDQFVGKVSG